MTDDLVNKAEIAPNIEAVIAPWSLPNEAHPMLFQWSPEDAVDRVSVQVPGDYKVKELLNANRTDDSDPSSCSVRPIHPGFVGFHLVNSKTPEEVVQSVRCDVTFHRRKGETILRSYRLVTVRPRLELLAAPTELLLEDMEASSPDRPTPFAIKLRHTGLGVVQIQVKCTVKGVVVSQSEDVLRSLIRSILELGNKPDPSHIPSKDRRSVEGVKAAGLEVEVDPMSESEIDQVKKLVQNYLETGILSEEVTSPESLQGLKEFFAEVDSKTLNDLWRDQVFNLYTRQILEAIGRFPSDFAEMASGPTSARLDSSMREMRVSLTYSDSQGNEYPSIELSLPIKDRRESQKGIVVPLGIEIENNLIREVPSASWTL